MCLIEDDAFEAHGLKSTLRRNEEISARTITAHEVNIANESDPRYTESTTSTGLLIR